MADTKLADLTALTAPSGDDLLYVVDDPAGTPSDKKLALDNLFTRGTVTVSSPVIDAAQTWNAVGTTFTGLKFNATDTASAAASLLMDLQVGGTSQFKVDKAGALASRAQFQVNQIEVFESGAAAMARTAADRNIIIVATDNAGINLSSTNTVNWSGGLPNFSGTNGDTILTRRGAANLRFGAADAAAPVAQTLSVQSGTAGASALTVSISGTALTIAGAITGTIAIGHAVTGTGVSAGTLITAGSGTSWTVNNSQTVGPITAYFNSVGQNLTITGSQGSGPSAGGSIIFQVAPAGAAATTAQNALATALTITSDRIATFASQVIAASSIDAYSLFMNGGTANRVGGLVGTDGVGPALFLNSAARIVFGSGLNYTGTGSYDLLLLRDAANTLALRNSTNAQAFRVYNTFTDASNYERGFVQWSANEFQVGAEAAGTGTARATGIYQGATQIAQFSTNQIYINRSLIFQPDNTYDIGAAGANRPRVVYAGVFAATSNLRFTASTKMAAPSDGVLNLTDSAGTNFNRLQFGGTTSSFPALKRSSTTLIVRLADDTANAALESASLKTDAPTGGTAATWKLGTVASVTPTLQNRTIEVDIGGTIYYLSAKTTND
jgi:hypothetical protein